MKLTFEDVINAKDWLTMELAQSLTGDIITDASEKKEYEVKLLVNGVELEPTLFEEVFRDMGKFIELQAENLVRNKLDEIDDIKNHFEEKLNTTIEDLREKLS